MPTAQHVTKVLFVFLPLGGGGAERQFALLIAKLDRRRFDPYVVSIGTDQGDAETYVEKNPDPSILRGDAAESQWAEISKYFTYRKLRGVAPIHCVRRASRWSFAGPVTGVMRAVRSVRPDIIFCFYEITALAALPAALLTGVKLVQGVRGTTSSDGRTVLSETIRLALSWPLSRRTTLYIGNSQGVVENLLRRKVPMEKCRVVFNGVEVEGALSFDAPMRKEKGPLRVGVFARFYPMKDHRVLLRAIALLRGKVDVVCHLYGNGPLRSSLEGLCRELRIADRVVFEGWVPNGAEKMRGLDVVALTSNSGEGFNNSLAEAQMLGLPVVTTDAPGCSEIVVDGETGFVVPVGSAEGVAAAIATLADPELRKRLGAKAQQRARSLFSVERMVRGYERLFDELMGRTV